MKRRLPILLASVILGLIFSLSSHFILRTYTYLPALGNGLCMGDQGLDSPADCTVSYTKIYRSGLPIHFYTEKHTVEATSYCFNNSCKDETYRVNSTTISYKVLDYLIDFITWTIVIRSVIFVIERLKND
jgi:hypothetical protein